MNSVHFRNEDDWEDYKTAVRVLSGRNTLGGTDLNWKDYALKYTEKGMKGILSYTNSFLIFSLQ